MHKTGKTLKFEAISNFTQDYQVILPAHPRLKYYIDDKNIELTNIALIDPTDNKPSRVRFKFQDKKKIRVASRSGKEI